MKVKGDLNIILDRIKEGVIVVDQNSIVRYANSISGELLEVHDKELINRKFEYPVLKNGSNEIHLFSNNQAKYLELSFQEINWNKSEGILISINDITESKLLEKELLKEREILQSFHDYSPICMQSLDKKGVLIDVNPAWLNKLEYKKKDVIGKPFIDFLHPDSKDEFRNNFPILKEKGFANNILFRIKNAKNIYLDIELNGTIGYDSLGEMDRSYCIFKDITEQKIIEENLRQKIDILEEAEEISKIGHWELDLIFNRFNFSNSIYKIFEIHQHKNKLLSFDDFLKTVHPDDRDKVQNEYQESVRGKQTKVIEHRIITGENTIKYIQEKFKTEYNKKGFPVRSIGMVIDITESKKTQNAISESEELYRELFESESDAIFLIENKTSKILKANKAAEILYGYSVDQLLKMKNIDLSAEPDETRDVTLKTPVVKNNIVFIPLRYHKNSKGQVFPVEITGRFFNWKNKEVHIASVRDISERIKMTDALIESQRKLSVLMHNLPGMAYRCKNDSDYTMLFVSDGCKDLTGYNPDDLINNKSLSYSDLIHEDSKQNLWDDIQQAITEKRQFQVEYKIITKDGEEKWVWEKGIGVDSGERKNDIIEGFISDITELKNTEQKLLEAKESAERSDKLKSSFLANMSHEIRTPMNGIVGFSKLLLKDDINDEKRIKYVDIINNCGKQLLSIIGDVLDISRIETGNIEIYKEELLITDFLQKIYQVYVRVVEDKGIKLILEMNLKKDTKLIADRTKLEQIISNLINNALKFTDEGEIRFGCTQHKKSFEFFVKDTGIGINPNKVNEIFDRFNKGEVDVTNKYGGTGLGLSISKAYVELMGGKIWVESSLGQGSRFYFNIPYNSTNN